MRAELRFEPDLRVLAEEGMLTVGGIRGAEAVELTRADLDFGAVTGLRAMAFTQSEFQLVLRKLTWSDSLFAELCGAAFRAQGDRNCGQEEDAGRSAGHGGGVAGAMGDVGFDAGDGAREQDTHLVAEAGEEAADGIG